MKHLIILVLLAVTMTVTSCRGGGRVPAEGVRFSEGQIEDIKNENNPLREGTTYFHSASLDYSVKYPNSFKDFKKDGDKGFTCRSRDGVARLTVHGEAASQPVEEQLAQALAQLNSEGATIDDSTLDDDSFTITGQKGKLAFYQRTITHDGKRATLYYEYDTTERENMDPDAIYSWVGPELGESLIAGEPPVETQAPAADPNAVAQVAYVGTWHTFSTMRGQEPYTRYPEFKDVNTWEASTDGKEVYLVLATHPDTKITVKNTVTGERIYNSDSRPLVVRCNKDGEPDVEITFIRDNGKIERYVPRHDDNGRPVVAGGIADMTR